MFDSLAETPVKHSKSRASPGQDEISLTRGDCGSRAQVTQMFYRTGSE